MKEINGVKQPEVGDVFRGYFGIKYRVYNVLNIQGTLVYFCYVLDRDDNCLDFIDKYSLLESDFKDKIYLGKAKNPITSLFEVE